MDDSTSEPGQEAAGRPLRSSPVYPGRQVWVEWHWLLRGTAVVLFVAGFTFSLLHREVYEWACLVLGVGALVGGFLPFRRQRIRVW